MQSWRGARGRLALAAIVALGVAAPAARAQVAPTLPQDTLGGRRLPAAANVPAQAVAPTLPQDTLPANAARPEPTVEKAAPAASPARDATRGSATYGAALAPTLPRDTLAAGARDSARAGGRDSIGRRAAGRAVPGSAPAARKRTPRR